MGIQRRLSNKLLASISSYTDDDSLRVSIGKINVGRLLQAGWHSPTDIKKEGIKLAVSYLPSLRLDFLELLEEQGHNGPVPRIFGDYIVALIADTAFGSAALKTELLSVIDEVQTKGTRDCLIQSVALIHVLRRLVDKPTMATLVDNSLKLLEKVKSESQANPSAEEAFTAEEEMRILIGLGRADVDSEQLQKTIRNKLKRVARRAPAVAQSLLPYKQNQRKTHPASKSLPKS